MSGYKPVEYLENTKAPVELLGMAPMLNPLADHDSAQRLMMFSGHLAQAQVVHGREMPRLFSGFEAIIGDYEFNTTERSQDVQLGEIIPRFIPNSGMYPIRDNPYYTIVCRGDRDNKIGYFQLEKYTQRSDGFGYKNIWSNTQLLNKGNFIPKEVKFCTSPAHDGNRYMMGTNLRVAYMSIPQVTEDAFVISESAARKLCSDAIGKVSFKILPNQIPLNRYGSEEEHRFMPDIGDCVADDGILCALRTPSADTIISDMSPDALTQVQFLHDTLIYIPPGAQILDIDIVVNRKCRVKTPKEIFAQVQKYRDHINAYHIQIWEAYQNALKEGREITPEFNSLVTRSISSLLADNVRIPGYSKKADVTLVKKKEAIEFIYITVTYKYVNKVTSGFKLTGRHGNKGVAIPVWKDEDMPIDEQGFRCDIIIDPVSGFNRMNPGQWYEQFINRGAEFIQQRVRTMPVPEAFAYIVEFLSDVNPKWGELIKNVHNTPYLQEEFVAEVRAKGMFVQVSPFQKGIDQKFVCMLKEKYNIQKSPVTFSVTNADGTKQQVTTKKPVMIGSEYFYLLYKMPHMRSSGVAYVNQYHSPVRPSSLAKLQYPFSQTPIRLGEDEIRNVVMTSGEDAAARVLGLYANSSPAVNQMTYHLLFDKVPSQLDQIEMSTDDIIASNSIIGVTKHLFSCFGVDISPKLQQIEGVFDESLELPTDKR